MKPQKIQKNVRKQIKKNKKPLLIAAIGAGIVAAGTAVGVGLRRAFRDIKESAEAQHEIDKAEFAAACAESKADFAEARVMGRSKTRRKRMAAEHDRRLAEAETRKAEAEARIEAAKE